MKHTSAAAFVAMLCWPALELSAQQTSERTRFLRDLRIEAGETGIPRQICLQPNSIAKAEQVPVVQPGEQDE